MGRLSGLCCFSFQNLQAPEASRPLARSARPSGALGRPLPSAAGRLRIRAAGAAKSCCHQPWSVFPGYVGNVINAPGPQRETHGEEKGLIAQETPRGPWSHAPLSGPRQEPATGQLPRRGASRFSRSAFTFVSRIKSRKTGASIPVLSRLGKRPGQQGRA